MVDRHSLDRDQSREVSRERRETQPWLHQFFLVPAIVGCVVVGGVAVVYYFEGSCRFFDCIDLVPYRKIPIMLVFLAFLVKWLEKLWNKLCPPAAS
jgi:hypothetical protein